MPERDANQLAADVPDEVLERIQRPHNFVPHSLYDEVTKLAENALGDILRERRELVALVATLQQERDEALAALHPHSAAVVLKAARAEDVEAALAEVENNLRLSREAHWETVAQLATTRQALAGIAEYEGPRIGRIRWKEIQDIARRALADTGGDTHRA
jgi:hypothetical protein